MALTTAGVRFISQAILGQGAFFNATNARIGVGNGSTAFAVAQTDLQGSSKFRKSMDDGYPLLSAPKVTFKSTFRPEEANFAWAEWGIFNASSGGVMLNRVVESNGTKQSNQTWILEVEVTFTTGT
jgi:hypothetical protein